MPNLWNLALKNASWQHRVGDTSTGRILHDVRARPEHLVTRHASVAALARWSPTRGPRIMSHGPCANMSCYAQSIWHVEIKKSMCCVFVCVVCRDGRGGKTQDQKKKKSKRETTKTVTLGLCTGKDLGFSKLTRGKKKRNLASSPLFKNLLGSCTKQWMEMQPQSASDGNQIELWRSSRLHKRRRESPDQHTAHKF